MQLIYTKEAEAALGILELASEDAFNYVWQVLSDPKNYKAERSIYNIDIKGPIDSQAILDLTMEWNIANTQLEY